jgi:transcriptional regulator with XRE-family HTH domain
MIKAARQERNLTQEELGRLVGVQKLKFQNLKAVQTVRQLTPL